MTSHEDASCPDCGWAVEVSGAHETIVRQAIEAASAEHRRSVHRRFRRVVVAGSRDLLASTAVADALDAELRLGDVTVVHGGAPGADTLGAEWAALRRRPHWCFPADWDRHARAAGPLRNRHMLDEARPDLILAFPLPDSRGTWDCVQAAKDRGLLVRVWPQDG